MNIPTILLATTLFTGCSSTTKVPIKQEEPKMSKLSFYYTDGSGNHFRFWQEAEQIHFEYDPVQPQFSSSGVYSGGTAKKGILTAEQAAILRQRFTFWQEATAEHVERRMKGVSILSIEKDKGRTSFLVPESKLKELSAMLRPLRP